MAYADKTISPEQLLAIVNTLGSRDAYFELAAAYVTVDGKVHEFAYQVPVLSPPKSEAVISLGKAHDAARFGSNVCEGNSDDRVAIFSKNYESIAKLIQSKQATV